MKKMLTVAAIAAFAALAVSCDNKKSAKPIAAMEVYSDSIYMMNDSTMADLQTYVYEGIMPSDAGMPANYLLAITSYGLNADGTYTLTESYTETNGKVNTNFDEGEKIVMVGIPDDSTAIVYELISYYNRPRIHLLAEGDSTLRKLDKDLKRASKDWRHKLKRK